MGACVKGCRTEGESVVAAGVCVCKVVPLQVVGKQMAGGSTRLTNVCVAALTATRQVECLDLKGSRQQCQYWECL